MLGCDIAPLKCTLQALGWKNARRHRMKLETVGDETWDMRLKEAIAFRGVWIPTNFS